MIKEINHPAELEKLMRDSYANYVIQTAVSNLRFSGFGGAFRLLIHCHLLQLDYADPDTKQSLVENLRPIMPTIRMTPYGRRIQSKIQTLSGVSSDASGAVFETSYHLGPIPPLQTQPRLPSTTYAHYHTQMNRQHMPGQNVFPMTFTNDMVPNSFIL